MVNVALGAGIPLLAHQGGWDEILLVVVPIAIVGALLWLARRRIDRASVAADGQGGRAPLRSGGGELGRRSRSGSAGRHSPRDSVQSEDVGTDSA
jgi:hypothetical protein